GARGHGRARRLARRPALRCVRGGVGMTAVDERATTAGTETTGERVITYAEAVREAMAEAMTADERVFLFGEDVGVYGGAFGVSGDLVHRFGTERVIDTPISELGIA